MDDRGHAEGQQEVKEAMKTTPSSTRQENDIARVALDCAQAYLKATRATVMPDADFDGYQAMERIITDFAAPLYEQKEELARVVQLAANLMNSQHAGCSERMTCTNHRSCELLREAERLLAEIRGGGGQLVTDFETIQRVRVDEKFIRKCQRELRQHEKSVRSSLLWISITFLAVASMIALHLWGD
jgi:hypothetical protein